MIDPAHLPDSPRTILVTRLDGLGDIVLGTQLLSGLHAKWPDAKVFLVVRPQMAGVGAILPEWVEVRVMPFDPRQPVCGQETQIIAQLSELAANTRADLAVVAEYNRTWAGEILADTCGAATVLAFDGPTGLNFQHRGICDAMKVASLDRWQTVHADADTREPLKYAAFLDALGLDGKSFRPSLVMRDEDRGAAKELWAKTGMQPDCALVCFPSSGTQFVQSLDAPVWSRWITRLASARPVVLLGSQTDEPVLRAIRDTGLPAGVRQVLVPTEKIGVTAAFLEQAGAYLGMDTGPMHLAAVLGTPTLAVFGGGHRAERFLPVGRRTGAIRMPLGCYGCDWLCPFDRRMCIKDIPEAALHQAGEAFLNDSSENGDGFTPRLFDIHPPAELPTAALGAIMRQHRQFLNLNHEITEHHAFLAEVRAGQQAKLDELSAAARLVDSVARQNHEHGEVLNQLSTVLTEMTRQNAGRDQAIAALSTTLAAMSGHNAARDEAIGKINAVLAEMTQVNAVRDEAISELNKRIWFVPKKRK